MLDQHLQPARRIARHHQGLVVHRFVDVVRFFTQHRIDRAQHLVPLREGLKAERTACINRIRGLLTEFDLVFAQTAKVLREVLTAVIEDASNDIAGLARLVIERAQTQWKELDEHILWCDERIAAHLKQDKQAEQAAQLMRIGPVTASAVVATVGGVRAWKTVRCKSCQRKAWHFGDRHDGGLNHTRKLIMGINKT